MKKNQFPISIEHIAFECDVGMVKVKIIIFFGEYISKYEKCVGHFMLPGKKNWFFFIISHGIYRHYRITSAWLISIQSIFTKQILSPTQKSRILWVVSALIWFKQHPKQKKMKKENWHATHNNLEFPATVLFFQQSYHQYVSFSAISHIK